MRDIRVYMYLYMYSYSPMEGYMYCTLYVCIYMDGARLIGIQLYVC